MRLFDDVIGFSSGGIMPPAPTGAVCDESCRKATDDAASTRPSTPRLGRARRADMSAAAFRKLTIAWAGAVLAVLLLALTVRWLG